MNTLGIPDAKFRLGKALLAGGILTREYLEQELDRNNKRDAKIAKALLGSRYPSENDILRILAKSIRVPNVRMKSVRDKPQILRLVPEEMARRNKIMALDRIGNILVVVTPNIGNADGFAEVRQHTGCFLAPIQCPEEGFLENLATFYQRANAGQPVETESANVSHEAKRKPETSPEPVSLQDPVNTAPAASDFEPGVLDAIPINDNELANTRDFQGLFIDVVSKFEHRFAQPGPILVEPDAES